MKQRSNSNKSINRSGRKRLTSSFLLKKTDNNNNNISNEETDFLKHTPSSQIFSSNEISSASTKPQPTSSSSTLSNLLKRPGWRKIFHKNRIKSNTNDQSNCLNMDKFDSSIKTDGTEIFSSYSDRLRPYILDKKKIIEHKTKFRLDTFDFQLLSDMTKNKEEVSGINPSYYSEFSRIFINEHETLKKTIKSNTSFSNRKSKDKSSKSKRFCRTIQSNQVKLNKELKKTWKESNKICQFDPITGTWVNKNATILNTERTNSKRLTSKKNTN